MKTSRKKAPISALEYWKKHGREHCQKLAAQAGTNYDYWKRICNLRTRPGIDLARRLVELSRGELAVELLCPPSGQIRRVGAPPLPGGYRVGAVPKKRATEARPVASAGVAA